jgi:hypothetical protein
VEYGICTEGFLGTGFGRACWPLRTTAKNLLTAIVQRMPLDLRLLKQKCGTLAVIPVSDSAPACICIGRHFKACTTLQNFVTGGVSELDGVVSLHSACRMHQIAITCGSVLKGLKILSPMFCASVLMQKGTVRRDLKMQTLSLLNRSLRFAYAGDPCPENLEFLQRLFDEIDWVDEEADELLFVVTTASDADVSARRKARVDARSRLARNLCGSTFEGNRITQLTHICRYGCHSSEEERPLL